jgi:septation ring formation regulator EzrA
MTDEPEDRDYLARMAKDIQALRSMMTVVINHITEAESEIPEKMRRFMTYMHDLHDIKYMHEELGHSPPNYIMSELRRCDDRYRHLLEDLNTDTGTFERVRQEMTERGGNRWEHTRLFPKENK